MRVGITMSGVGPEAAGPFVRDSAVAAERAGFSTLYLGEHVVLFAEYPGSTYPYAGFRGAGEIGMPDPSMPIVDPLIALTWAAAATSVIELATGVLILPQRNPVVLAKQLATLDAYSGGRLVLGAGVGWCREEYDAIGVPWAGRGARMDEHLQALRRLLEDPVSTFQGETVRFRDAHLYPKPVRPGGVPVLIGGESDRALARVARHGDGWLAYRLGADVAAERIATLRALTVAAGRDPDALRIVVGVFPDTGPDEVETYRAAGVTELNLVVFPALVAGPGGEAMVEAALPPNEPELTEAMRELAARFTGAPARA